MIKRGNKSSGAEFSDCQRYRFSLWRMWDRSRPKVAFIGLNPSTADETNNDPTVTRCIRYAHAWGYGGMFMLNIFAFRATLPKNLRLAEEPIGTRTDRVIVRVCRSSELVVAAWGIHGEFRERGLAVRRILADHEIAAKCFGRCKHGEPRHPLYLRRTAELLNF